MGRAQRKLQPEEYESLMAVAEIKQCFERVKELQKKHGIWIQKGGEPIRVVDMHDRHLRNTYRLLKRKGYVSHATKEFYLSTAGPRGEMAQDAFMQEFDAVMDCPAHFTMDIIEDELRRRKINYHAMSMEPERG